MREIPLTTSSIKDITFLNLRKKNQFIAESLSKIGDDIKLFESLQKSSGSSNVVSMETEFREQSVNTKPNYCKSKSIN